MVVRSARGDHASVPREFDHQGANPGARSAVVRFDTGETTFAKRRHHPGHGRLNRDGVDFIDVVDQGVGNREDGARTLGGFDELLDRHARLGDVRRAVGAEPVGEHPIPRVCVLFADELGVQIDHGAREMGPTDGVHVSGHFGQVREREVFKTLFLEQRHQRVISTVAVVAKRSQLLLQRMLGLQWQEVGQHVDVARFGDAVAHSRELRIAQRDLDPGHHFQAELLARRGHFFVTQRRVVVGQGDRRYTQIVRLFGQLRGSVRSVGERGVGVKI